MTQDTALTIILNVLYVGGENYIQELERDGRLEEASRERRQHDLLKWQIQELSPAFKRRMKIGSKLARLPSLRETAFSLVAVQHEHGVDVPTGPWA